MMNMRRSEGSGEDGYIHDSKFETGLINYMETSLFVQYLMNMPLPFPAVIPCAESVHSFEANCSPELSGECLLSQISSSVRSTNFPLMVVSFKPPPYALRYHGKQSP
jgi:hypothetical protein